MHVDRVVYDDGRWLREQPFAVLAIGPKQPALPEITRWKQLVEVGLRSAWLAREELLAARVASRGVFVADVGGVFPADDVSQVAEHIHGFMVADHDVYLAAGYRGFRLQANQQVHDLARVVAAVEQVAQADEVRLACRPA